MTSLAATGLSVRRGARAVLHGIELAARRGEFIAVIGPNGSGKSTLLAALAGLLRPEAGEVRIDGTALSSIEPRRLAALRAYLPQNPRCDWALAVERVVALGLMALPAGGATRTVQADRIATMLAEYDLSGVRDRAVTSLSGGELARVMLARALVSDPAVVIVDEPLAGLDPRHAWEAACRLQALARTQGRLVIAAMHDLNIALRCANRIWALKDGVVLANGAPEAVMDEALLQQLFEIAVTLRGSGSSVTVDFIPQPGTRLSPS